MVLVSSSFSLPLISGNFIRITRELVTGSNKPTGENALAIGEIIVYGTSTEPPTPTSTQPSSSPPPTPSPSPSPSSSATPSIDSPTPIASSPFLVPQNCEWGAWQSWGFCSVAYARINFSLVFTLSCGPGVKQRKRPEAVPAMQGGFPCSGGDTQEVPCFTFPCQGRLLALSLSFSHLLIHRSSEFDI